MVSILFSVFDKKSLTFSPVMPFPRREVAERSLIQACKDPNLDFNKWPDDFAFYEMGSFDNCSGKLEALPQPLFVNEIRFYCSVQPQEVV